MLKISEFQFACAIFLARQFSNQAANEHLLSQNSSGSEGLKLIDFALCGV
ncbi:hypothetical protein AVDCRST_MAG81-1495 [uncultured Synechococcales cyanobacterium]|uniref:Uncharacterized protein n=1 Tax=uncultured Synechococcales cyanobacterium TaxID=1936017 RepID=A0A6J4V902_9CYAN|nr:hypothetical protein AVDCRST_MAG81-1495 [uncultured Synechococcales cyanobacterium]